MQIEYKPLGSEVIMYIPSGVKELKEVSQYISKWDLTSVATLSLPKRPI